MKRGVVASLLLCGLLGGGWYWWHQQSATPVIPSEEQIKDNAEDAIGLALKGIELVQGEKGIELWRLHASWAALRQEKDIIEVEKPDIIYRVGEGEIPLHVTAEQGTISEGQRFVRLWGNVVCTYENRRLESSLMVYDSTTRMMTFPEGATLVDDEALGTATLLSWNLDTTIIEGSHGVAIEWQEQDAGVSGKDAPNASASVQE